MSKDNPCFLPFSGRSTTLVDNDPWWTELCDEYIIHCNFGNSISIEQYVRVEFNAEICTINDGKLFSGLMFKSENDKLLFLFEVFLK